MIADDQGFSHLYVQTGSNDNPSDELCDGDRDDDKELEDVNDPEDMITDDNGFVHQWLMTGQENMDEAEGKPKKTKFSDELCDGDKDDDRELEDELNGEDHVVDINGYLQTGYTVTRYSDELANGDESDDKEIWEEEDMNDPIVDYNGHTNAGYGSMTPSDYVKQNHIFPGHHIQGEPRTKSLLQYEVTRYSDELANGDESDDKELHEEEDMNDPVVDYNGHTNAGYGAITNKRFFDRNHIFPGHHIQGEPRTKALIQMLGMTAI